MTTEAPTKSRTIEWEDVRLPPWLIGTIGGVGLIAFWWIVSAVWVSSTGARPIPSPPEVIGAYIAAGWDYFARNFAVTLTEAGIGYLWGNGLALLMSGLVLIVPRLEGVATGGPSRSCQAKLKWSAFLLHLMSSLPSPVESAPYFSAFV